VGYFSRGPPKKKGQKRQSEVQNSSADEKTKGNKYIRTKKKRAIALVQT
jgi:hypothetical protein